MYVKVVDGVATEYTLKQLRKDYPRVSFPKFIPDQVLAKHNVYPVTMEAQPQHNPTFQKLAYTIEGSGVSWNQSWSVVSNPDMTDEQLRTLRHEDNAVHAKSLIEASEMNPKGTPLKEFEKEKENARRNNRTKTKTKKLSNEDSLR